jgi:hypothetical protein
VPKRIGTLTSLLPGLDESIPTYCVDNVPGEVSFKGFEAQVVKKASLTSLGEIIFLVLSGRSTNTLKMLDLFEDSFIDPIFILNVADIYLINFFVYIKNKKSDSFINQTLN